MNKKDWYKITINKEYPDLFLFENTKKPRRSKIQFFTKKARRYIRKIQIKISDVFKRYINENHELIVRSVLYTPRTDILTNTYVIAYAFYNNPYIDTMQGGRLQENSLTIKKAEEEYTTIYFKPVILKDKKVKEKDIKIEDRKPEKRKREITYEPKKQLPIEKKIHRKLRNMGYSDTDISIILNERFKTDNPSKEQLENTHKLIDKVIARRTYNRAIQKRVKKLKEGL